MQLTQPHATSSGRSCADDSTLLQVGLRYDRRPRVRGRSNRQFRKPVEKQAARLRASPVEPERELVQIVLKMPATNAALQGSENPSFQQADNQMAFGQDDLRKFFVSLDRNLMIVPKALIRSRIIT